MHDYMLQSGACFAAYISLHFLVENHNYTAALHISSDQKQTNAHFQLSHHVNAHVRIVSHLCIIFCFLGTLEVLYRKFFFSFHKYKQNEKNVGRIVFVRRIFNMIDTMEYVLKSHCHRFKYIYRIN